MFYSKKTHANYFIDKTDGKTKSIRDILNIMIFFGRSWKWVEYPNNF